MLSNVIVHPRMFASFKHLEGLERSTGMTIWFDNGIPLLVSSETIKKKLLALRKEHVERMIETITGRQAIKQEVTPK
jgi:hypothetical protein